MFGYTSHKVPTLGSVMSFVSGGRGRVTFTPTGMKEFGWRLDVMSHAGNSDGAQIFRGCVKGVCGALS